ncbi:hemerythrin domain-containing protein [Variovorax soli]|uniref:Hemerythrin-like domain-containing protein n=1 Tax=Variovorax soli TaxID=376815 RepID=A0ABU1NE54_9BURK|nr:hemerythrin domain-containing protein [Variovorax soli]MDR6536704.1 hemerythrin-like domain-containing protein [Variovorax soli]
MTRSSRLDSLIASPAAGFEQPFEMMEACHQRVQRTLRLLARLQAHVARHGADRQAQQAARDVMRYFDLAAPQHHLDEELHVFPALVERGEPAMLALVARLQQDHLQMEARWRPVRALLEQIERAEIQAISPASAAEIDAFTRLYGAHIESEEQLAYPAAAALLDDRARDAMGAEMRRRRGALS